MKVKPIIEKLSKFSAAGQACTSVEFNQLKDGKSIKLSKDAAKEMASQGLVEIVEKKSKKGVK